LLNSVNTTVALINANAIIVLPAKDTDRTDASVANMPNGGSIGRRLDGRAPHTLNFGNLVATGANSLAYYPVLQLSLSANGGATLGRAPRGLTEESSEAEADAYLSNPQFYPPGMFDDTVDGNGDPMHNAPLFRTDLGAPGQRGGHPVPGQLQQSGLYRAARSHDTDDTRRAHIPAHVGGYGCRR